MTSILKRSEVEVVSRVKYLSGASAYRKESKKLVLLQVNCMSFYNKSL